MKRVALTDLELDKLCACVCSIAEHAFGAYFSAQRRELEDAEDFLEIVAARLSAAEKLIRHQGE